MLLFICISVRAQRGLFPLADVEIRAVGGTGLSSGGAGAVYTNPAGLAESGEAVQLTANAEQRFGLEELAVVSAGAAIPVPSGGFGLLIGNVGFGGYRESRVGLAYGRKLADRLHLGAELNGFGVRAEGYAGRFAVTGGVGVQFLFNDELTFGARLFGPVRSEISPGTYLPRLLAMGVNYQPNERMEVALEVHRDDGFPLRVRTGVRYRPVEQIGIRIGVTTAAAEASFGLDYQVLPRLRIGGAGTYHETLGVSPTFGISWR